MCEGVTAEGHVPGAEGGTEVTGLESALPLSASTAQFKVTDDRGSSP